MRSLVVLIFLSSPLFATASVDAIDPAQVCDRFIDSQMKSDCLRIQKSSGADSYLASICEKQFGDQAFFACLKMTDLWSFDPKKLQSCGLVDMEDQDRLDCLARVGTVREKVENRLPASDSKKKNHRPVRKNQRNSR